MDTQDWKVTRLTYEFDTEPYAKQRDAAMDKMAAEAGVEVVVGEGHTLHHPEAYLKHCKGADKVGHTWHVTSTTPSHTLA
jgi:cryptochrome